MSFALQEAVIVRATLLSRFVALPPVPGARQSRADPDSAARRWRVVACWNRREAMERLTPQASCLFSAPSRASSGLGFHPKPRVFLASVKGKVGGATATKRKPYVTRRHQTRFF